MCGFGAQQRRDLAVYVHDKRLLWVTPHKTPIPAPGLGRHFATTGLLQ